MSSVAISPGLRQPRPATRRPTRLVSADARRSSEPVRLTRRGRLVLTLLFLTLVLAALVAFGASSAATRDPGAPVPTRTVVVERGDTLWQIAGEVAGPGEIREVIHQIIELNALSGAGLVEGQRLAVPLR